MHCEYPEKIYSELGGRLVLNRARELKCNSDAICLAVTANLNVQSKGETILLSRCRMTWEVRCIWSSWQELKIRSDYEHTDFWHE